MGTTLKKRQGMREMIRMTANERREEVASFVGKLARRGEYFNNRDAAEQEEYCPDAGVAFKKIGEFHAGIKVVGEDGCELKRVGTGMVRKRSC